VVARVTSNLIDVRSWRIGRKASHKSTTASSWAIDVDMNVYWCMSWKVPDTFSSSYLLQDLFLSKLFSFRSHATSGIIVKLERTSQSPSAPPFSLSFLRFKGLLAPYALIEAGYNLV
jgi:hypothetical protein